MHLSSLPLSDVLLGLAAGVLTRCKTLIHKESNFTLISEYKNVNKVTRSGLHVSKLSSSSELTARTVELKQVKNQDQNLKEKLHGPNRHEIMTKTCDANVLYAATKCLCASHTDLSFLAALSGL